MLFRSSMVLSLLIISSKTVTAQTWFLPLKNVAIFCPKILAVLKHCGKVFGGMFFDSFRQSEQESEEISALDALLAKIIIWRALVVHNCRSANFLPTFWPFSSLILGQYPKKETQVSSSKIKAK